MHMGKARAKEKKKYIKNLQKSIDELNQKESNGQSIDKTEKMALENKLNDYYKEKQDGYILRSKMQWVDEGERSSKYFLNLEKSKQSNNVIKEIQDKDGNIHKKDNEILKECALFYENLFSRIELNRIEYILLTAEVTQKLQTLN